MTELMITIGTHKHPQLSQTNNKRDLVNKI